MKYLCLIYLEERELDAVPCDVQQEASDACIAHTDKLRKEGKFLASERLESVRTATTVRYADGKVAITDGPFAETKEQLAGFYLIDAKDLDEALQVAADIPPGRFGAVEVRPVRDY